MGGTGRERVGGKVYRLSESFMLNGENLRISQNSYRPSCDQMRQQIRFPWEKTGPDVKV